jgi:hypothetical protein
MPSSLRVSGIVAVAALVASLAMAVPASADQAFHTQRIPLSAVADAPLKSGAVIDIHTQAQPSTPRSATSSSAPRPTPPTR